MREGYIKLHRKVMKSAIWQSVNDWRLASTVLLMANWEPGEFASRNGDIIQVKRGEFITSLKTLKEVSLLTSQEIRTSLVHLEKADFLTNTSTSHFRHIKVKKYSEYQDDPRESNKDLTIKKPRRGTDEEADFEKMGKSNNDFNKEFHDGEQLESNKDSNKDLTRTQQGLNNDIRSKEVKNTIKDNSYVDPELLLKAWNDGCPDGLPKASGLSNSRRTHAVARLKELSLEGWGQVINRIRSSKFCLGENDRGWTASFDWLIRPDTAMKVMEGKYDNRVEKKEYRDPIWDKKF